MAANRKSSKLKDGGSGEIVFAHKAIFARHSALLTEIFNIAEKKQVAKVFTRYFTHVHVFKIFYSFVRINGLNLLNPDIRLFFSPDRKSS